MRQLKISKSITNREDKSLSCYLNDISHLEMITAEEETLLARKIRDGDQAALDKLVTANLRFVVSVAKQYQNYGLTLPDLINEGNVGLIKAAERFDETRGFKFISYAVWWIRQGIMQAIAEQSRMVRLPMNRVSQIHKIRKAMAALEQEHGREPTHAELAETMETTPEEIDQNIKSSSFHTSFDAPVKDGEEGSLLSLMESKEMPSTDAQLSSESLKTEIERSLATLTAREGQVLKMFFGLGYSHAWSLTEIAESFDLTRERVRQIKETSIRKLKLKGRSKLLRSYLGG